MQKQHKKLFFITLIMIIFVNSFLHVFAERSMRIKEEHNYKEDYLVQQSPNWELMKKRVKVKGIYITGNTVSFQSKFNKIINLVDITELNALVMDVKNDEGFMTYKSDVELVSKTGSNNNPSIKDIDGIMKLLNEKKIYPIARIVTFKDRRVGDRFPNLAIKNKNGGIWRDRKGMSWLNPYNKEAWNYIMLIAEEAVSKGFKEIQFDYVRFPTDGNLKAIEYGESAKIKSKSEAIAEFLAYARERLSKKGVVVSADVFGLVTTAADDMSIGQYLESLTVSADVLCPMVYPSHYGKGFYGVSEPDFEPYKIVYHSMKIAHERVAKIDSRSKAILRPWLQDFTAKYLPRYKNYGPDEVRAQITAVYDAGGEEWILWNAGNNYTQGALNSQ